MDKNLGKALIGLAAGGLLVGVAAPGSLTDQPFGAPSLDRSGLSIHSDIENGNMFAWVMADATSLSSPRLRVWVDVAAEASQGASGAIEVVMTEEFSRRLDNCEGHESAEIVRFDALQPEHREAFNLLDTKTGRPHSRSSSSRRDSELYMTYRLSTVFGERSDSKATEAADAAESPDVAPAETYHFAKLSCDLTENTWTGFARPNYIMQMPTSAASNADGGFVDLANLMITRTDSGLIYESGYEEPQQASEADLDYAEVPSGNYYEWREDSSSPDGTVTQADLLSVRLLDLDEERRTDYKLFVSGILLGLAGALLVSAGSKIYDLVWNRFAERSE